jgi:predicted PurR-regulated permease PerM
LGVEGSATLAFFVAILDILPVIGVGTVLIPWSIIAFLMSDTSLGIGLIVLFLVNAVIRQLIEPKILGKSLDLHPLLTLMLIYVGFSLFGIWGLILLPLLAVSILFGLKNKGSAKID